MASVSSAGRESFDDDLDGLELSDPEYVLRPRRELISPGHFGEHDARAPAVVFPAERGELRLDLLLLHVLEQALQPVHGQRIARHEENCLDCRFQLLIVQSRNLT